MTCSPTCSHPDKHKTGLWFLLPLYHHRDHMSCDCRDTMPSPWVRRGCWSRLTSGVIPKHEGEAWGTCHRHMPSRKLAVSDPPSGTKKAGPVLQGASQPSSQTCTPFFRLKHLHSQFFLHLSSSFSVISCQWIGFNFHYHHSKRYHQLMFLWISTWTHSLS